MIWRKQLTETEFLSNMLMIACYFRPTNSTEMKKFIKSTVSTEKFFQLTWGNINFYQILLHLCLQT